MMKLNKVNDEDCQEGTKLIKLEQMQPTLDMDLIIPKKLEKLEFIKEYE